MLTKTISIEVDAYDLLKGQKLHKRESFSQVVHRAFSDHSVLSSGELDKIMDQFQGKGAGKKRQRRASPG